MLFVPDADCLTETRPDPRIATVCRIGEYLDQQVPATPVLVIDVDKVEHKYHQLHAALPTARIYFAVKANPLTPVIDRLRATDCCFDVASMEEIRHCLASGVSPDRMSFGNTIKKPEAIAFAYQVGVRLFAADCESEVRKIAKHAPGSQISIRLLTSGEGAEWPLSRKFGCDEEMAEDLLLLARELGLEPWGVAFHVGSQQTDPGQWDKPIASAAALYRRMARIGLRLPWLNLGGGFPATYRRKVPSLDSYADAIEACMLRHFGPEMPRIAIEPGRCLVAEAGVIEAEVIMVSRKSKDGERWVYLDCGKFGGLAETIDEAIQYPLQAMGRSAEMEPAIIAGPTCDSADILYERTSYNLPSDLVEGDRVRIMSAGAYTHSYSAIGFNGFAPLQAICI